MGADQAEPRRRWRSNTPRGLVWVFGVASVLLNAGALWRLESGHAMAVLVACIPSMLALCGVDVWANREKS